LHNYVTLKMVVLYSDSASPKPGGRRRSTLIIFVLTRYR